MHWSTLDTEVNLALDSQCCAGKWVRFPFLHYFISKMVLIKVIMAMPSRVIVKINSCPQRSMQLVEVSVVTVLITITAVRHNYPAENTVIYHHRGSPQCLRLWKFVGSCSAGTDFGETFCIFVFFFYSFPNKTRNICVYLRRLTERLLYSYSLELNKSWWLFNFPCNMMKYGFKSLMD